MKKLFALLAVKKAITLFALIAMLFQQYQVQAQALPVAPAANFVMNRAIGGILTRVAAARGFAANDPRIAATLVGAGSSLTAVNVASTAAGVGLAVAGAPVWLTVAAGLGVLAVGAAIVAGRTSLKLTDNYLIVDSPSASNAPGYSAGSVTDSAGYYKTAIDHGVKIYKSPSCYSTDFCGQFPPLPAGNIPYSIDGGNSVITAFFSLDEFAEKYIAWRNSLSLQYAQSMSWASPPSYEIAADGKRRMIADLKIDFICDASKKYCGENAQPSGQLPWKSDIEHIDIAPTEGPAPFRSLAYAYPNISDGAKAEKLSNDTLAKLADQAWMKAAAQPGYQGLPYSVTQPVTVMDVATWKAENPVSAPTIGDLLTPANNPGTSVVPISPTVTVANPSPDPTPDPDPNPTPTPTPTPAPLQNVNVVNAPKIDLGPDPETPDPTLETAPTAWQILSPIMALFPQLKRYQAPAYAGECPKPSFEIFGKSIVMESHCTIAEQHRQIIFAVMLTTWLLVGLLIVLSA